ncbi:MAG: polysaccharide deacetylase family protein [Muribaculaceae bacterium]|nr:polysaccharide deacetylase family protein [Muribaculaceae bacterium]
MHLVEHPPLIYRWLFGNALWRMPRGDRKCVYLTFDDGPIPDVTPWVLEILRRYNVRATFFMVGENIMRNPHLLQLVREAGHAIGNHSLSHMQGMKNDNATFLNDIDRGAQLTGSNLFRPPHGLMKPSQIREVRKRCRLVMYDIVTRDYSPKLSPADVMRNVTQFTRDGSIIVFHDSLKAWPNLRVALPEAIMWLKQQGYEFGVIR